LRRSAEAAVRRAVRVKLSSLLALISRKAGLSNEDVADLQGVCDKATTEPMSFE